MRAGRLSRLIVAEFLLATVALVAQQPTQAVPPTVLDQELPLQPPGAPYKLHVYARLLQIPTVIQSPKRDVPENLTREQVKISLDQGPPFTPTFVRKEGNDPLSLVVLIEDSGSQQSTVSAVVAALPTALSSALHAQDKLMLFATDCRTFRSLPHTVDSATSVESQLENLLREPQLHGKKHRGACAGSLHLWDATASAIQELSQTEGRRVLLLVSQGDDYGSHITVPELIAFAASRGVAVFALRDHMQHESEIHLGPIPDAPRGLNLSARLADDPLSTLVVRNGGLLYDTEDHQIPSVLAGFLTTLRDRYIVEFTAPTHAQKGSHSILVSVPGIPSALVRASGDSAPLPDPAALADPTILPSKESEAVFGTQRPQS